MENLLDSVRLDKISLSDQVVELLGQGVQNLVRMVRAVGEGREQFAKLPYCGTEFLELDIETFQREAAAYTVKGYTSLDVVPEAMLLIFG